MKINKLFSLIFLLLLLVIITFSAGVVKADLLNAGQVTTGSNLRNFANDAGYNGDSYGVPLAQRIGNFIQIILGFVGTIFLILILISGFQWMTAGGNVETIKQAKGRIINAIIGLAIVLAAYSITWFITTKALDVTGITQEQTQP